MRRLSPRQLLLFLLVMLLSGCATGLRTSAPVSTPLPEDALRIAGSGVALTAVEALAVAYQRANPAVRFTFDRSLSTNGAIRGISAGTIDLAAIGRPVSEIKDGAGLEFWPFARDLVVFAVNVPNPVQGLTTAQLRDIYGGKTTNWRELGGTNSPIVVLDRPDGQTARSLVLLPLLGTPVVHARTIVLAESEEMVAALNNTPNSIGFTALGDLRSHAAPRVKVLSLDAVIPSSEAAFLGAYPWYVTYHLVNGPAASPLARRFEEWALGPDGQQVLQQHGYVALPK